MQAVIDRDGCIGCEICTGVCPDVFRMADDGKAEVFVAEIPKEAEDAAGDAEERCPVDVITIY